MNVTDEMVEAAWAALTQKPYTRDVLRVALDAALAQSAAPVAPKELPDDLRAPLHSLQADLDWLVARIRIEDDEVCAMLKDSIRTRLSHIEEASYRYAPPAPRSRPMSAIRELSDEEIERITDEGIEAGESAMTFLSVVNPYPAGSDQADIWAHAYRNAYARSICR